jgi:hypothetical protein
MLFPIFIPFLGLLGNPGPGKLVPEQQLQKIILVDVSIPAATDAKKCYLNTYDTRRVEVNVEIDDPLVNLADFELEEDPIESGNCYLPELKIIYSDYTYVISLYCACIQKYQNSAPYTPGQTTMPCDIQVTESMISYLQSVHKKYFGVPYNPSHASKLIQTSPMGAGGNIDDIIVPDDKDDDDDISKDAIDKEGWFDDIPDPVDYTNVGDPDGDN